MNFFNIAINNILAHLPNDYKNNWDKVRFGCDEPRQPRIKSFLKNLLHQKNYFNLEEVKGVLSKADEISFFEYLYNHLESDDDKKLLLEVISFRFLGHKRVKLPLSTPLFWTQQKQLEQLQDNSDYIDPNFLNFKLYKMDITSTGYPIKMYFTPGGIVIDFIVKQYEYKKDNVIIKAEEGDVVIDGGACWGDTALYFASEVKSGGQVFSFEFIPNNISIFNKNLSLNPELAKLVTLLPNPLWQNSSEKVYYKDYGPGSNVSLSPFEGSDGECNVACIDDLVLSGKINRVNLIKLDIEGAELKALNGSIETIKKFKPKLAIALYHNVNDFDEIPRFLKSIVPEYKFYFSHCSIHAEESMLFAKI